MEVQEFSNRTVRDHLEAAGLVERTDLDATKALLDRLGVRYVERPVSEPRRDEAFLLRVDVEPEGLATDERQVIGYNGFFTEMAFRADGTFCLGAIWE